MRSFASCTKACTRTEGSSVFAADSIGRPMRVDGAHRLAGLALERALALELAHEELEPRMVGADRAHGVHRAREPRQVLFHQRPLGLHEEFLGDAVEAAAREVVAGVAREHGAVKLERILSGRLDERALRERESRGVEHLLDALRLRPESAAATCAAACSVESEPTRFHGSHSTMPQAMRAIGMSRRRGGPSGA